ncbi:protein of unknown function [Streptomyces sp. KY75]|nr:protein of unknown function [Streptomyces sp. KY70]CAD5988400.1 protein of unknown function [Streptomyces sp. KY75]
MALVGLESLLFAHIPNDPGRCAQGADRPRKENVTTSVARWLSSPLCNMALLHVKWPVPPCDELRGC